MLIKPIPIIVAFAFNGACKLGNVVTIVASSNVDWPYGNVCDAEDTAFVCLMESPQDIFSM